MTGLPPASAIRHGDPRHTEAVRFLYDRINYETIGGTSSRYPFRLQRMRNLLQKLGLEKYLYKNLSPPGSQQADGGEAQAPSDRSAELPSTPLVHIAGTKGKGSTSTMVAAMLTASGYRTGLYTSPHLHQLEERFRVDAQQCSPEQLVALVDRLREAVRPNSTSDIDGDGYSFFELTTALAILHFDLSKCDCVVLEVGLGGRLDSTNVCAPSVTAITSIGLDHQHVLGNTLAEIAAEKAGIIKTGVPVVCGVLADEPRSVIQRIAAERSAPVFQRGRDYDVTAQPHVDWGTQMRFIGRTPPLRKDFSTTLALEGVHQAGNAAVALSIIDLLHAQGLKLPPESPASVLSDLQCSGRIERYLLPNSVLAIVDSAHNEDSIGALCATLKARRGNRPVTIVFGTSRDKDADVMLRQLATVTDRFVLTRFLGNPRFQLTSELQRLMPQSHRDQTAVIDDPIAACEMGLQQATPSGMLVVCGSFFLAAETRGWMAEHSEVVE